MARLYCSIFVMLSRVVPKKVNQLQSLLGYLTLTEFVYLRLLMLDILY